jgi:hypothetical protein
VTNLDPRLVNPIVQSERRLLLSKSTIVTLVIAVVALVALSSIFLRHRAISGATPSDCASFQSLQMEFEQKFVALPLNSKPAEVNSPYLALLTQESDAYLTLYKHTSGYFATHLFQFGQAINSLRSHVRAVSPGVDRIDLNSMRDSIDYLKSLCSDIKR